MIWGNISRSVNGENVLGGVAYKYRKECLQVCLTFKYFHGNLFITYRSVPEKARVENGGHLWSYSQALDHAGQEGSP